MSDDIAVIGMAGRFPGAPNLSEFWQNLRAGVESIDRLDPHDLEDSPLMPARLRAHPDFVPAAATLADADMFDHALFGMSLREARWTDPQQRVFLELAWAALEDAALDPARAEGRISVYAGASHSGHLMGLLGQFGDDPASVYEAMGAGAAEHLATRTAFALGLRGEAVTLHTACSTGLAVVHAACQSLLLGQSNVALAGAVRIAAPQRTGYLYQEGMILSRDGHCRAFDAQASGTVPGNGAGVIVLKLLDSAVKDGDHVYAVIKATAINNDGHRGVGFTAPSVSGQAEVVAEALEFAGLSGDDIGYVEAHGTGTPLGDPIEVAALARAYRQSTQRVADCPIGTVKANVGHLDAAAGIAGLIKVALMLHHGEIPPTLHVREPNPAIDFAASPFFPNTELRPWPRGDKPRRAAVSSFGIGGTNVHAILEEAPQRQAPTPGTHPYSFHLSARTPQTLRVMAMRLADHLESHPCDLADVAHTLAVGRAELPVQSCFVAADVPELIANLREDRPATEAPPIEVGRRIPLPHYPFERVDCRFEATAQLASAEADDVEGKVMLIWQERLGSNDFGVHDNFLELGGNSLMAAQMLTRLREAFSVELPLSTLFDTPTVAGVAEQIRSMRAAPAVRKHITRSKEHKLSVVQERTLALEAADPGNPALLMPIAVEMRGRLDFGALQAAATAVALRHDTLRTTFHRNGKSWSARVDADPPRIALEELPRGADPAARARADALRHIDVAVSPVRMTLLRVAEDHHYLLLTMHHVVCDTLSFVVFLRELAALYERRELPPLALQYADFAAWQRQSLANGDFDEQLAAWRGLLAGAPDRLDLPTDRSRALERGFRGNRLPVALPESVSARLLDVCQRGGLTPFVAVLAGYTALLARVSGAEDIIVGTPIGNRERTDLQSLIGYVAHCVPLRTKLRDDPTFWELAERVRHTLHTAYRHPDVPYEHLAAAREGRLLASAAFVLHTGIDEELKVSGMTWREWEAPGMPAMFGATLSPLTLMLAQRDNGFSGVLEYASELFTRESAQRLMDQLCGILDTATREPHTPMSQWDLAGVR